MKTKSKNAQPPKAAPFPKGDKKKTVVAVSGGFDPLHIGHVRLLNEAKKLGDKLVVILNNDNWLDKKKGFAFMLESDRKEILESLSAVDEVILTSHVKDDADRSVCRELLKLRPDIFANGGDRTPIDAKKTTSSLNPEVDLCEKLGIATLFNVGKGGKVRSSTELVTKFQKHAK
ncbi:MAG: adenylyltransferase/cytidyltransferase family protein [bacterium]|nr:adenylyltransferase/cytidyltransferase family protein [bacterium]